MKILITGSSWTGLMVNETSAEEVLSPWVIVYEKESEPLKSGLGVYTTCSGEDSANEVVPLLPFVETIEIGAVVM